MAGLAGRKKTRKKRKINWSKNNPKYYRYKNPKSRCPKGYVKVSVSDYNPFRVVCHREDVNKDFKKRQKIFDKKMKKSMKKIAINLKKYLKSASKKNTKKGRNASKRLKSIKKWEQRKRLRNKKKKTRKRR